MTTNRSLSNRANSSALTIFERNLPALYHRHIPVRWKNTGGLHYGISALRRRKCVLQKFPSGLPRLFLSLPWCRRGKFRNRNAGETSQGTRDYFGWGQRLRSVYKAWSASHESWNPAKHDTHANRGNRNLRELEQPAFRGSWSTRSRATRIHLATACLPCSPMQFVGTSPRYSINNTGHAHLSLENNLGPRGRCTHAARPLSRRLRITGESECNPRCNWNSIRVPAPRGPRLPFRPKLPSTDRWVSTIFNSVRRGSRIGNILLNLWLVEG